MAKPRSFSFSIKAGDALRLATAMRDITVALEPLTDEEAAAVTAEIARMYRGGKKPRPLATTAPSSGVRRG